MSGTVATPSVAEQVRSLVEKGTVQLPPLPELALELRQLLAQDKVDATRVADLVHNDAAVASTLLRIANSATFGGLRKVTDLRQAIARLGFSQVGSIVTTLLLKGTLTDGPANRRSLLRVMWNQSICVASCSRALSMRAGVDAEQASLAGLLHDCGRLAILRAIDHLESKRPGGLGLSESVLNELLTDLHCEIGHLTLMTWKLPEEICEVALKHEEPCDEHTPALVTCVQAADAISRKLGFHVDPDPELDLADEAAIELLRIKDMELATLMVDLEDDLEDAVKQFGATS